MIIRIFDKFDDLFLRSEWERLEKEGDVFPQSTYHWCSTWWKHLSGARKLHVVMVLDDQGNAMAIAPLCIEQFFCIRILRSIPINYCDFYQIVTSSETNAVTVFDTIYGYMSQYERWHVVLLTPVNDHYVLFDLLRTKGVAEKHLTGNIVADISAVNWDKYLGTVSRNRRRLTKKKMQALEADCKVEVELVTVEPGYTEHFDRIREIQDLRATKDRVGRSHAYMQCVRETNGHQFADGRMGLYLIKADGIVISYRIGILNGTTYYDWNTNYDIKYSDYSPGLVGLAYVIRDLIERGFTTLDFMAGVYDYKLSYSSKHEMRNNYLFIMKNDSNLASFYCKYQLVWRDELKAYYRKARSLVSRIRRFMDERLEQISKHIKGIGERVRQYGLRVAVSQLFRAVFRRIYEVNRDTVFIIPDFAGCTNQDLSITVLSRQRIEQYFVSGELDGTQARLLTGFIDEGCIGVCAEVNGKLAGYAWVQLEGVYSFGRTGRMTIPPQHAVFKNLFIMPEFRGQRLGQKLVDARLSLCTPGSIPMTFIMPENRYSIRNWHKHGAKPVIAVIRWRWLGGKWQMRLTRLSDHTQTDALLKAIEDSNNA